MSYIPYRSKYFPRLSKHLLDHIPPILPQKLRLDAKGYMMYKYRAMSCHVNDRFIKKKYVRILVMNILEFSHVPPYSIYSRMIFYLYHVQIQLEYSFFEHRLKRSLQHGQAQIPNLSNRSLPFFLSQSLEAMDRPQMDRPSFQ
jgi:hypothetical protein